MLAEGNITGTIENSSLTIFQCSFVTFIIMEPNIAQKAIKFLNQNEAFSTILTQNYYNSLQKMKLQHILLAGIITAI